MKDNFFYEPDSRLHTQEDFELLCESLRECEINLRKEQIDFETYLRDQHNKGVSLPDMAILETYEGKQKLNDALAQYKKWATFMKMYLNRDPYALIGDYRDWERINNDNIY